MKIANIFTLCAVLVLTGCRSSDLSGVLFKAEVVYIDPGPCCSNMELTDSLQIDHPSAGYSESILDAVNINDFLSLGFQNGDTLSIDYIFAGEPSPCDIQCNRHHGIPIQLVNVDFF